MISKAAKYLETIYKELNKKFFNGEVPEAVITIQSTPYVYGHCSIDEVWDDDGEKKHEINIGAENLNREIVNVCATLIHEMTHLLNMKNGIQDCSPGNTYHNKHFKEEAEKHGIVIEQDEFYDWTITSPSEELKSFCAKMRWRKVGMNRGEVPHDSVVTVKPKTPVEGGEKKKSSSRKYVCPKCGTIIRATKEVRVMCADCGEMFIEVK